MSARRTYAPSGRLPGRDFRRNGSSNEHVCRFGAPDERIAGSPGRLRLIRSLNERTRSIGASDEPTLRPRGSPGPYRLAVRELDPDRLRLGVLVMGVERLVVAAEARQLVASERRRHVALGIGVHAD